MPFTNNNLWAPESFIAASEEEKAEICNGVGPRGFLGKIIPETIWGLSISDAADIHDWMYHHGRACIEDKEKADRVFLNNMLRIIYSIQDWPWMQLLRERRAIKYYEAVRLFGGPSFWANKKD